MPVENGIKTVCVLLYWLNAVASKETEARFIFSESSFYV
jgi:hypothetical protein